MFVRASEEAVAELKRLGCEQVEVRLKPGEAVFWYNGVCHGNLGIPSGVFLLLPLSPLLTCFQERYRELQCTPITH